MTGCDDREVCHSPALLSPMRRTSRPSLRELNFGEDVMPRPAGSRPAVADQTS